MTQADAVGATAGTVGEPLAPARDLRVDFIRGLALIFIFIDHNSFDWLTKLTLQRFSLLDAAEVFFFLSGYSSAFAYGRVLRSGGFGACTKKALRRCSQLYLAEAFLFGAVLSIILLASHFGVGLPWSFAHYFRDLRAETTVDTLTLRGSEPLLGLGLLPVYIVFIALTPLALRALDNRRALVISLSAGLYLVTQIASLPALAGYWPFRIWYLNPFAWQSVFVAGLTLGHRKLHNPQLATTVSLKLVVAAVGGLVVVAFLRNAASDVVAGLLHTRALKELIPTPFPLTGKHNLELLRLVNLVFWLILLASVNPYHQFFKKRLARIIVVCGQNSLAVYCVGVILNYVGIIWINAAGGGKGRELAFTLAGCAAMAGVAFSWRFLKSLVRRDSSEERLVAAPCACSSSA